MYITLYYMYVLQMWCLKKYLKVVESMGLHTSFLNRIRPDFFHLFHILFIGWTLSLTAGDYKMLLLKDSQII